jgi:hypothetical protein
MERTCCVAHARRGCLVKSSRLAKSHRLTVDCHENDNDEPEEIQIRHSSNVTSSSLIVVRSFSAEWEEETDYSRIARCRR